VIGTAPQFAVEPVLSIPPTEETLFFRVFDATKLCRQSKLVELQHQILLG
jgi:hypothetical protein